MSAMEQARLAQGQKNPEVVLFEGGVECCLSCAEWCSRTKYRCRPAACPRAAPASGRSPRAGRGAFGMGTRSETLARSAPTDTRGTPRRITTERIEITTGMCCELPARLYPPPRPPTHTHCGWQAPLPAARECTSTAGSGYRITKLKPTRRCHEYDLVSRAQARASRTSMCGLAIASSPFPLPRFFCPAPSPQGRRGAPARTPCGER